MSLSSTLAKFLASALTSQKHANDLVDAVNAAEAAVGTHLVAGLIVATNVSTTLDFGALKVGDKVLQIAATPGNPGMSTVVTAGTLAQAAVVGDSYVVFRAYVAPAASTFKF
jgi:hypothetical protein